MDTSQDLSISAPSLPKGGGAIQSIGKGWGAVGVTGAASLGIALPISAGRGVAPGLGLGYSSAGGRSEFGQGWSMGVPAIARQSSKGVPQFVADSRGKLAEPVYVTPSGDVLLPERNADGSVKITEKTTFRGQSLGTFKVTLYTPRAEGGFDLYQHFTAPNGTSFWMIQTGDGSLHIYGKTARIESLQNGVTWVAEWLLEETVAPNGEQVRYRYLAENQVDGAGKLTPAWLGRDYTTQRYLARVSYGNVTASQIPFLFLKDADESQWLFELVFDYGESSSTLTTEPGYPTAAGKSWPARLDPISSYRYGFEVRTLRLCRQVLMFHVFEPKAPTLVQRLVLEYAESATVSQLIASHSVGYASDTPEFSPPYEFDYTGFGVPEKAEFTPFFPAGNARSPWAADASAAPISAPGVNSGRYQLVDLFGEGLSGILCADEQGWWYRRPVRGEAKTLPADANNDVIDYAPWELLERIPTADLRSSTRQFLSDLNGDGKLDWVVAKPGMAGFFTLNPNKTWQQFTPYAAFPSEFFSPQAQLADLIGDGLSDLALIGTRSVRLYGNLKERGYAPFIDVAREAGQAGLPVLSDGHGDVVAFSDILGTGQQHLLHIRADRVTCFPSLGRGRFGDPIEFGPLAFAGEFNPDHIRLADLDGSGAADIVYFQNDCVQVFMNLSGHGFAEPIVLQLPTELHYSSLVEVSVADLRGIGCSSLVITRHNANPTLRPEHWRCDLVAGTKPYLLRHTDNNMGAEGEIFYRSSAQEWLDEKAAMAEPARAISGLPFPVHVVSRQTQLDQITGNRLVQHCQYRGGYYDGIEREFRGFGLLLQTDTEALEEGASVRDLETYTAPVLSKTWFHVGKDLDIECAGAFAGDALAPKFGPTRCTVFSDGTDSPDEWANDPDARRDAARLLSGSVVRNEVWAVSEQTTPYSVSEARYSVRMLQPRGDYQPYSVMQAFTVEERSYQYNQQGDDPLCQHSINFERDRYGAPRLSGSVAYARRASAKNPFKPEEAEGQAHLHTWWNDACDPAQENHYLTMVTSLALHLDATPDYRRLHLPYRSQGHACELQRDKCVDASGKPVRLEEHLSIEAISASEWSHLLLLLNESSVLTGQSRIKYQNCEDGQADFMALPEYTETAELDAKALEAYLVPGEEEGEIINLLGDTPQAVDAKLLEAHYTPIGTWNFVDNSEDAKDDKQRMWATRLGFATFAGLNEFFLLKAHKPASWVTVQTTVEYDKFLCLPIKVTAPDGCVTQAEYDYRTLQVVNILDPNQNTQQARYDGMGRLLATSFFGTEWDFDLDQEVAVGFHDVSSLAWQPRTPSDAIENFQAAIGDVATACFYAPGSWMGLATPAQIAAVKDPIIRAQVFMPNGELRASARQKLHDKAFTVTQIPAATQAALLALPREPVHSAVLQADRYPDDAKRQIRIAIAAADGFGRALQTKQKVPAGPAWSVVEGELALENGQPKTVEAPQRWRVSARVEYNNKGLPVRSYRPYFADSHLHIRDESFRQFGYCDRQYYDPLGRPTETYTPREVLTDEVTRSISKKGNIVKKTKTISTVVDDLRRTTFHTWYTVAEDENDTAYEMEERRAKALLTTL